MITTSYRMIPFTIVSRFIFLDQVSVTNSMQYFATYIKIATLQTFHKLSRYTNCIVLSI